MPVNDGSGWPSISRDDRTDPEPVHARRETGAAPDPEDYFLLHDAAENDSPEAVAELAQRVHDVDFLDDDDEEYPGRTPLWTAVFANRPDNARVLVSAGADPWRPMMNGWSPGRLSLAGPTPALFSIPPGATGLSPSETAAVAEARRLIAALGDLSYFGLGMACVLEQWDTHPGGGGVYPDDPTEEILTTYLYHHHPVAYCCARTGLHLTDARAITGPPDMWLRLPERDWWN